MKGTLMKTLRRWAAAVVTSFEYTVRQIENHDALISSAIKEAEASSKTARRQLERVKSDGKAMRTRIEELHNQAAKLKKRAASIASSDRQQALACVQRFKQLQHELAKIEIAERDHARIERALTADMTRIEQQLFKLSEQQNLLRTRQARMEAARVLNGESSDLLSEADRIFMRWEEQLEHYEALLKGGGLLRASAELGECFIYGEELRELEELLQKLVADSGATLTPKE
ncbi:MAG: hypothetical protein J5J00_05395 [Deltaproteobacteria bacterium]|nr:hypothetical protein [Deltaproteobacteria bacterium]